MLGGTFAARQDQAGEPCSIVLSAAFWRERLSGDARALGQNLTVDGQACSISGVMPDGFAFPLHDDEFWMPLQSAPDTMQRGTNFLDIIARLKPGVTLAPAKSELKVIARALKRHT